MAHPDRIVTRRSIENAIDAELDWDVEKIGTVVGFLGELPAHSNDKMTVTTLWEILGKIYEDLTTTPE